MVHGAWCAWCMVHMCMRMCVRQHLRVAEDLRIELHVARRVHPVHVAEGRGDGELGVGHRLQRPLHHPHLLRFGVEVLRIGVLVVDAVLLAAGDPQLHLKQHVHLGHPFHVLDADLDVLAERLLREVEHVRREERLAVRLEVLLVRLHEPVEPRQPRALAVVRVQDDRDAVQLGHLRGRDEADALQPAVGTRASPSRRARTADKVEAGQRNDTRVYDANRGTRALLLLVVPFLSPLATRSHEGPRCAVRPTDLPRPRRGGCVDTPRPSDPARFAAFARRSPSVHSTGRPAARARGRVSRGTAGSLSDRGAHARGDRAWP